MSKLMIEAAPRTALGGKVKALRREGWVPVVVYGNVDAPINLQVNQRAFERMLHGGGSSQLVEVTVQGGGSHNVLIRDVQRHPVRHSVIHADFYAINLREKQQVSVPVTAVGTPEAVDTGLMMLQALDEIEIEALVKMQELSTKYVMGISIDQVQLKNINPPRPVQESFNEVNQAQQSKEKLINEARREYNKVIPLAEGEKDQRIREADGYRLKRINEAEGDALRFNALFTEYQKAPEVTRRRIYIETMQDVLPKIESKVLMDDAMSGLLPLLNLDGQKERKQ